MHKDKQVTIGQLAYDIETKEQLPQDAIELGREMRDGKDGYLHHLFEAVENGKKQFHGDFFIVVLSKRERLLTKVFRNYFFARQSCPTPTYDQTVFRYLRNDDVIEFIWTVPDLETATVFKANRHQVAPEEMELLKFVLDFYDGTLDKIAKTLNNEE